MADGRDDVLAPGPPLPPILGLDPTPWVTAEQIQQGFAPAGAIEAAAPLRRSI